MAKSSSDEDYLAVIQVAEELRISVKSVRSLIKREELPAYQFIGRRMVVARSDLEVFKESRHVVPADETKEEAS